MRWADLATLLVWEVAAIKQIQQTCVLQIQQCTLIIWSKLPALGLTSSNNGTHYVSRRSPLLRPKSKPIRESHQHARSQNDATHSFKRNMRSVGMISNCCCCCCCWVTRVSHKAFVTMLTAVGATGSPWEHMCFPRNQRSVFRWRVQLGGKKLNWTFYFLGGSRASGVSPLLRVTRGVWSTQCTKSGSS